MNEPGIAESINQFLIGSTFEKIVTSDRVHPQTEINISARIFEKSLIDSDWKSGLVSVFSLKC